MTIAEPALVRVLRRDRVVVLATLGVVALLAWTYLVLGAGVRMDAAPMVTAAPWTPRYAGVMMTMWALMLVAMMLPSAAPMILLFAAITRRAHPGVAAVQRTAAFGFGYICVWLPFAAFATGIQWGLTRMMLLSPAMTLDSPMVSGALFLAAGAPRTGLRHGLRCLGCCWMLMGLLFVGGVMNLLWIAALALIVLIEKAIPRGPLVGRALGVGLVACGITVLIVA